MICLNTHGQAKKRLRATIVMKVDMEVGGDSDEDRKDSVAELFDDHYDEIVQCSYFKDGIQSMVLDNIEIIEEKGEVNG